MTEDFEVEVQSGAERNFFGIVAALSEAERSRFAVDFDTSWSAAAVLFRACSKRLLCVNAYNKIKKNLL